MSEFDFGTQIKILILERRLYFGSQVGYHKKNGVMARVANFSLRILTQDSFTML
jgi:hypothetical protein